MNEIWWNEMKRRSKNKRKRKNKIFYFSFDFSFYFFVNFENGYFLSIRVLMKSVRTTFNTKFPIEKWLSNRKKFLKRDIHSHRIFNLSSIGWKYTKVTAASLSNDSRLTCLYGLMFLFIFIFITFGLNGLSQHETVSRVLI